MSGAESPFSDSKPTSGGKGSAKSKKKGKENLPEPPPYASPNETDGEVLVGEGSEISKADGEGEADLVQMQFTDRTNNFPPFPKCCPCKPCFYHNIPVDIPPASQAKTRALCSIYVATVIVLFLNLIACLAVFVGVNSNGAGVSFGLSLAWFFVWTPLAFLCWYWPVYKAFRSDSSMWFMFFFFIFFIQIAAFIVAAVGIEKSGYSGFIYAIEAFNKKNTDGKTDGDAHVVGAISFIVAALWAILAAIGVGALIVVHRYYRSSGLTVAQAKGEMKDKGMKDLASN